MDKEKLIRIYDWVAQRLLSCGADKWAHFTLSLIMAFLVGIALKWYWGFVISFSMGVFKEYAIDQWLRGGKADFKDLRADWRGAAVGGLFALL